MASDTPAFKFYPQAQTKFEIPLLANDNIFLQDIFGTENSTLESSPISAGFFRVKQGEPLTYTYKFDEMKIFLEGDFTITDGTGQTTVAKPGDVVYFPKGSVITFSTSKEGLAFYAGARNMHDY